MTDAQIDTHLDAVLKASGSALRYYSMQKPIDDMRAAMRAAVADLAASAAPAYEGEPDMHAYAARLERQTFEMRKQIEALDLELRSLKAAPVNGPMAPCFHP